MSEPKPMSEDKLPQIRKLLTTVTDPGSTLIWLVAEVGRLREGAANLQAGVRRRDVEIARLRKALRMLVEDVDECIEEFDPGVDRYCSKGHNLSLGSLPAAREALNK